MRLHLYKPCSRFMKNRNLAEQFTLFPTDTEFETQNAVGAVSNRTYQPLFLELVSFRDLVPEINDTGYLTHAIFAYPAKFIPKSSATQLTPIQRKGIGLSIRSRGQER